MYFCLVSDTELPVMYIVFFAFGKTMETNNDNRNLIISLQFSQFLNIAL